MACPGQPVPFGNGLLPRECVEHGAVTGIEDSGIMGAGLTKVRIALGLPFGAAGEVARPVLEFLPFPVKPRQRGPCDIACEIGRIRPLGRGPGFGQVFERLFDSVEGVELRGPNDIVFDAAGQDELRRQNSPGFSALYSRLHHECRRDYHAR